MSKKDEYFATMESQIKKWDAEVDKLRARSDQMTADARAKYDEQLSAMRANRDAAHKKLQEIPTASESAWQNMQAGMDAAWGSMKSALDKASSQFKKQTVVVANRIETMLVPADGQSTNQLFERRTVDPPLSHKKDLRQQWDAFWAKRIPRQ